MARDLRLGRLRFVTALDDLKETLGETFEAIGAGLFPSEGRPRPFPLSLPLHGDRTDTDDYAAATRLRRQVRALLENQDARLEGLYLAVAFDSELNGWLLPGGGDIEDTQSRGIVMGDWKLSLTDVYKLGSPRAVRPARRLVALDRRLATTPRDYLKRIYSTDFAAQTALAEHHFPEGSLNLVGVGGQALGDVTSLQGRVHGEVVSFDLPEASHGVGDVLALDRRDVMAPTWSVAGDADPQGVYGWEEMYGPEQGGYGDAADPPVLQNMLCRVRWLPTEQAFSIERGVAGTSQYADHARAIVYYGNALARLGTLADARLIEWTPERAVMALWSADRAAAVYVTLQRGWRGPRIEVYAPRSVGAAAEAARIRVVGSTTDSDLYTSSGNAPITDGAAFGDFTTRENWAYMRRSTTDATIMAVLQDTLTLTGRTDATAYGGGTRDALDFHIPGGSDGYVSVRFSAWNATGLATQAQQVGQKHLIDARSLPELVAR